MSFLDHLVTEDNKPWGPERYKNIIRERYRITKNANISYGDTGNMTPTEREIILQFIDDDLKRSKEILDNSVKNKPKRGPKPRNA